MLVLPLALLLASATAPAPPQSLSGIPNPAAGAQGRWPESAPGGNPGYRVQAASDGIFHIHTGDILAPAGGLWRGMGWPAASRQAFTLYRQLPGPTSGGLLRVMVSLHRNPDPDALGIRLLAGHNAGMRVLFTMVGTPADNSPLPWTEPPLLGLPDYAKEPPVSAALWAAGVRDLLLAVQNLTGELPDYVECWNEPDLDIWWNGTGTDLLELYRAFAGTLRAAFPAGPALGGFGMGRPRSQAPGTGATGPTFLEEAIAFADAEGLPLDFLSWHNYELSASLRFYQPTEVLRTAARAHGLPDPEFLVTEWNVYGRAVENPRAIEFDQAHAAAVVAGFLDAALDVGLTAQSFHLLQDDHGDFWEIADLLGDPGALSRRGIKKPSWRLHEFLLGMAVEPRLRVERPRNEWALSVVATRVGDRIRVVVGNDAVEPDWVWAEGCRERGHDPNPLWQAMEAVLQAGLPLTVENLMAQGLDLHGALTVLEVRQLSLDAAAVRKAPRQVTLVLEGASSPQPLQVWRFDSSHHDPADHREEFLPVLQWVDAEADYAGWQAASLILLQNGVPPPPYGSMQMPHTPEELASQLGIPLELAVQVWTTYVETVDEARLDHVDLVNSQPSAVLQPESPAAAGIAVQGSEVHLEVEPNAALVLDILDPAG